MKRANETTYTVCSGAMYGEINFPYFETEDMRESWISKMKSRVSDFSHDLLFWMPHLGEIWGYDEDADKIAELDFDTLDSAWEDWSVECLQEVYDELD